MFFCSRPHVGVGGRGTFTNNEKVPLLPLSKVRYMVVVSFISSCQAWQLCPAPGWTCEGSCTDLWRQNPDRKLNTTTRKPLPYHNTSQQQAFQIQSFSPLQTWPMIRDERVFNKRVWKQLTLLEPVPVTRLFINTSLLSRRPEGAYTRFNCFILISMHYALVYPAIHSLLGNVA